MAVKCQPWLMGDRHWVVNYGVVITKPQSYGYAPTGLRDAASMLLLVRHILGTPMSRVNPQRLFHSHPVVHHTHGCIAGTHTELVQVGGWGLAHQEQGGHRTHCSTCRGNYQTQ